MPYPATATPEEGESGTISPVLPSAQTAAAAASSSNKPGQPSSLSLPQLQTRAHQGDAGAQVDVKVQELHSKPTQKLVPAKGWVHFVAGGVGGMCGAIITSPLDVVKTRLQSDLFQKKVAQSASATSPGALGSIRRLAYHFVETGHLLKEIATKEGPRALFKGLGPTLVGVIPARSINFYTYGNGKRVLADKFNNGVESPLVHLSAAACAGIVTATATNPIWVVKTRLQLESHQLEEAIKASRAAAVRKAERPSGVTTARANFSTTATASLPPRVAACQTWATKPVMGIARQRKQTFFKAAPAPSRPAVNSFQMTMHIIQREGIRGLYKGMSASYLGVAEGTIQWVLYERLKRMGSEGDGNSGKSAGSRWSSMVGAAGTAKFVASLITYPHEVVRTRLRQQPPAGQAPKYTGLLQTIKVVLREEGAVALYGGLSAHLLRVVPNAVVMFSIYELTLKLGSTTTA